MSEGIYNETYFANDTGRMHEPGLLYIVVLVNKSSQARECVKIGITKGTNFKDAIKRSNGFKGYEIRIQKLVKGTIYDVWKLEKYLHNKFIEYKYTSLTRFGGHTELFTLDTLPKILQEISNAKNIT